MKILVTGGAGFIGSNLCEHLLNHNNKVVCLDNFTTGKMQNIQDLLENSNFTITHIAYELGYSNPANFTRAFNKIVGCSPQSYRLKHQNQMPLLQDDHT